MITDTAIQLSLVIGIIVQLVNWVLDIVYIVQRPCDSIMMTLLYVYFGYDISITLVEIALYRIVVYLTRDICSNTSHFDAPHLVLSGARTRAPTPH